MAARLVIVVQVETPLPAAGFAIGAEQLLQTVKPVGLFTEMTEPDAGVAGFRHLLLHFSAVVAMEAIALDNDRADILPIKNRFQRFLDRRGSRTRRAGDDDYWMLSRHVANSAWLERRF